MSWAGDEDFLARARTRLFNEPVLPVGAAGGAVRPAAVLIPVVARPGGLSLLLTQRRDDLPTHAGQISFPGGRMGKNEQPLAAALRETLEETGLAPDFVEPLGFLDAYRTSTGFIIAPVVGLVREGFRLRPCPREVAEIFEAPLSFFMDPANHRIEEMVWQGLRRRYWTMPWQERFVWGATAGMLRNLHERLYGGGDG